jgi:curved DNA-binding protein CbpA
MPAPPSRASTPPTEGELDLTLEQRERIDALYRELTQIGLYELLGASAAADTKSIKRSYNARVMEFHPDRFFRKRLGGYRSKLEAIMHRMTEAHDILCSAEHRARYDLALRSQRSSLVDEMIAEAARELADADGSSQRVSVPPGAVRVPSTPAPASTRSGTRPVTGVPPARPAPARRHAPAVRPSGPIENGVAKLRELHERHKRRPLEGAERVLYERLRDEVSRILLAAQRLGMREGETARGALRVTCALKLTLAMGGVAHQTVALDVSAGGLAAVIELEPPIDTRCELTIEVEPAPIRAPARVVGTTPHGHDTFRVSVAFDGLDPAETARLEMLVLDLALAKLQV